MSDPMVAPQIVQWWQTWAVLPHTVIWSCPHTKYHVTSCTLLCWPPEWELQSWPAVLPIRGTCPGITLLGLRINWHCVSGGRHWSSSSTPAQSVGLVGSLLGPPPSPPPLLPPSRMWLILMLKGNSWPKWKVRVKRLEVIGLVCAVCACDVEPKQKKLIKIRAELLQCSNESAAWSWDVKNSVWTTEQKILVTEIPLWLKTNCSGMLPDVEFLVYCWCFYSSALCCGFSFH